MWLKHPNRVRTGKKIIPVEFVTRSIVIVVHAKLSCVSGKNKILTIVIRNHDILVAVFECIKLTVRILFSLPEEQEVELIAICQSRSKQTHCTIGIRENETSKIAGELLGPDSH